MTLRDVSERIQTVLRPSVTRAEDVGTARGAILVGAAVHLASLLLPFGGFKCDLSPEHCAIAGVEYVVVALMWPSLSFAHFAAVCE